MEDKEDELNPLSGEIDDTPNRRSRICWNSLPCGVGLLERVGAFNAWPLSSHKALILILTFCSYASFHLARKSFSAVKGVLKSCSSNESHNNTCCPGWAPFNEAHGSTLLGSVDYSFLFTYAVAMFISGLIADRVNLRYFLVIGMLGSGVGSILLGVAYFANIHVLYYFILVQLGSGAAQSMGWPAVVAVMSHWFGRERRGLIMGIWNSNISIGNILGTIIPSIWATCDGPWGWSFVVPGFIIIVMSVPVFLLLVPAPTDVGLPPPVHYDVLNYTELEEEKIELKSIGTAPKSVTELKTEPTKAQAIGICRAILIPGVIEYSLALFFTKLVAYTFLYWLPLYIYRANDGFIGGRRISNQFSDWLSIFFDVGGIFGTILCGGVSDVINARALIIVILLYLSVPLLFLYRTFGAVHIAVTILLLFLTGAFVNGPFGIITTAVSSDLGTHESLRRNENAKATVAAIIDGTGSLGAAFGPLIAGAVSEHSWNYTFYILMASCFIAALLLSRMVISEMLPWLKKIKVLSMCFNKKKSATTTH